MINLAILRMLYLHLNILVFSLFVWGKLISWSAFLLYDHYFRQEHGVFYNNLGFRKRKLVFSAVTMDVILFLVVAIFIIIFVHE